MTIRRLLIGLMALVAAYQLVRNAMVQSLAPARPADAVRVWTGHPEAELTAGLTAIATATRERKSVPPQVFKEIDGAASKDPLAPEPFLVRGIEAQLSGNGHIAEQAFLAAKWRDGRSLPARYFLADLYFRRGDSGPGLEEVGALARLAPNGVRSLAPYVAAYAGNRATWPQLRALFQSEPRLEDEALAALAADARNTDTVLALASPSRRGPSSPWLAPLIGSLVKDGQYERARQVWASLSRVRLDRSVLLFDPGFTESDAPPPFNWTLISSTVGLAERRRGGGLHAIFYGQEDGALASQLLVLGPGQYRFTAKGLGTVVNADALQWRLTCEGSSAPLASKAVTSSAWTFTVAPACGAQRLDLFGSSGDIPRQSEMTVRNISLVQERPHA